MFFWTCLKYLCCLAAILGLSGHAISCLNDTVNGLLELPGDPWVGSLGCPSLDCQYIDRNETLARLIAATGVLRKLLCMRYVFLGIWSPLSSLLLPSSFLYRAYISQLAAHHVSSRRIDIYVPLLQISASYTAKKKHRDQRQPISCMSVLVTSRRHQQV